MTTVYEVKRGDSPWKFAATRLGAGATNQQIAEEVKKLPSIYGCHSIEEFQKKYFSKVGTKIEINFRGQSNPNRGATETRAAATNRRSPERSATTPASFSLQSQIDTSRLAARDATRTDSDNNILLRVGQNAKYIRRSKSSINQLTKQDTTNLTSPGLAIIDKRVPLSEYISTGTAQNWADIKSKQDTINNMSSDRDKIITYNRDIAHVTDNYIIVDKKNYTATVYAPDGKVVKSYEIGVSDNVSDQLIEGNGRGGWKVRATSAGIYTANYRATGHDSYARTYNDRILTLSNDGLREKGVGNGETGVALHQVPNGAGGQRRAAKLKQPGVSAENNRFSAGCVNFLPSDFDDCMQQIQGVGTKVYILPEDNNNYFCVKNGQLHFAQNSYTGNVATTTTKNDPIKSIRITVDSDLRSEASEMATTLAVNKHTLARDLGIDNDTYNMLALRTLGIAGAETKYGSPTANIGDLKPYWVKENMQGIVNTVKNNKGNTSYNSRGITQLKIGSYTDPDVKRLMNEYGITPDNLSNPQNAAIGTMIVLSCIYKNELPALKKLMDEQGLTKEEALLYCFNGRKSEITKGTATPDQNEYIRNVNKYEQYFNVRQNT